MIQAKEKNFVEACCRRAKRKVSCPRTSKGRALKFDFYESAVQGGLAKRWLHRTESRIGSKRRLTSAHKRMRLGVAFVCFCVQVSTAVLSQGQSTPSSMRVQDVFPAVAKHAHSSSIVEIDDGQLVACWFLGSGERRANDVLIQGAIYDAKTASWSAPFTMADVPGFPDCNPVLFVDQRRRLWLFWVCVLANRWECSQLYYRRADGDDGGYFDWQDTARGPRTVVGVSWDWQGVIHLKPGERFSELLESGLRQAGAKSEMWAEYAKPYAQMLSEAARDPIKRQTGWMTRIHPLQLDSGRILLPLYSDGFNVSIVARSDDQGDSWSASEPIVGLGPIQPSLVRQKDGVLAAYCRDAGESPGRVLVSRSRDEGVTWSVARDTELRNPGSSLEVIRLQDGRWLLVGNDSDSDRRVLRFQTSDNDGRRWIPGFTLEQSYSEEESFSYPSLVQTRDGEVHVTYSCSTAAGETIRHVRLPATKVGQAAN